MFALLLLQGCLNLAAPPSLESVIFAKDPFVDTRLLALYDENVRNNKHRLTTALDGIWKILPDPFEIRKTNHAIVAKHLVWFITLSSPNIDRREGAVNGSNGSVVSTMLEHIGLPAIPALLEQLEITQDNSNQDRNHRQAVILCIKAIYDCGGGGREMAIARIRLHADTRLDPGAKKLILLALESPSLKPPPAPVEKPVSK